MDDIWLVVVCKMKILANKAPLYKLTYLCVCMLPLYMCVGDTVVRYYHNQFVNALFLVIIKNTIIAISLVV